MPEFLSRLLGPRLHLGGKDLGDLDPAPLTRRAHARFDHGERPQVIGSAGLRRLAARQRVAELIEQRHGPALGIARLVAGRHRDELRAAEEAAPLLPPPDLAAIGPKLAVTAFDPQAELVAGRHHGAGILDQQAARHLDHRVQGGAALIVAERRLIGVGEHGHRLAIEQIAEAVEVMDRDLGDERLLDLLHPGALVALGWSRRSMQSAAPTWPTTPSSSSRRNVRSAWKKR